jgi:hypothetical protein
MTNFHMHDEQMVKGLRKISRASVFHLKWQHIFIYIYIHISIFPDRVVRSQLARQTCLPRHNFEVGFVTIHIDCAICIILACEMYLP